jgi:ABC-type multidrug transport system ATPase subunit
VLKLQNLTYSLDPDDPETAPLLDDLNLNVPTGHLLAVVGPSGCGKSTLLKTIAGIIPATSGHVFWENQDLEEKDLPPGQIGYVPQFSIAHDGLTVRESLDQAAGLRVKWANRAEREQRVEALLRRIGMEEFADRLVRVLSGGQKRRLGLALELVSDPKLLLCDEVTSGLDPKSETEIVTLMRRLAADQGRLVISVTHTLSNLEKYDSVAVLHQGRVVFHGTPEDLHKYFRVNNAEDVFPRLGKASAADLAGQWDRERLEYERRLSGTLRNTGRPVAGRKELRMDNLDFEFDQPQTGGSGERSTGTIEPTRVPGYFTQARILFSRRWTLFYRSLGQILLHLGLLFGFPILVVIFALDGLPSLESMSLELASSPIQILRESAEFTRRGMDAGSLVSGLVMFQVILLTLMGANNSSREIASERAIYEKEHFAGVRIMAYLTGKIGFLSVLVLAQSVWMAVFVKFICNLPGPILPQIAFLLLVNGAMTAICLGISSLMANPEQASLLSIYLVGFQLPLSGAVLALPEVGEWLTRPFIASYWGWSGYLQTLRDTQFYQAVRMVTKTDLSQIDLCFYVLTFHILIGLALTLYGCHKSMWNRL